MSAGTFTLEIDCEGPAFDTPEKCGRELGRILMTLGQELQDLGPHTSYLRDLHSHRVGQAVFKADPGHPL